MYSVGTVSRVQYCRPVSPRDHYCTTRIVIIIIDNYSDDRYGHATSSGSRYVTNVLPRYARYVQKLSHAIYF